jgi:hypothetical protein
MRRIWILAICLMASSSLAAGKWDALLNKYRIDDATPNDTSTTNLTQAVTFEDTAKFNAKVEIATNNITYVPLGADIGAAVAAAAAGDALMLAAGTYTITNDIDVTKKLLIRGQGEESTILTTTNDGINVFHITASGVELTHMSIEITANDTHGVFADGTAGTVLSDIHIYAVEMNLNSHAGIQHAISFKDASAEIKHLELTCTSADDEATGIYVQNESTAEAATIVRCHDIRAAISGAATPAVGFRCEDDSATQDCTLYIYNSTVIVTEGAACTSGALYNHGGANAKTEAESCIFGATDWDVYNSGGTVTLRGCTLANGTTSGTVTHDGYGTVEAEAYGAGWNGANEAASKDSVYDQMELRQPLDADLTKLATNDGGSLTNLSNAVNAGDTLPAVDGSAVTNFPENIRGCWVEYGNTTQIVVSIGAGMCNGNYFSIETAITHTMTGLAGGDVYHYIYIDDDASTYPYSPTIINATNEPSESAAKDGWYNGNDRCLGAVIDRAASTNVSAFSRSGPDVYLAADFLRSAHDQTNPDGTWETPNTAETSTVLPVTAIGIYARLYSVDADSTAMITWTTYEEAQVQTSPSVLFYHSVRVGSMRMFHPLGASRNMRLAGESNDDTMYLRPNGWREAR